MAEELSASRAHWPRFVAGVTGGIASGKSVVCRVFESEGVTCFSADQWARDAVQPGSKVLKALTARYGSRVIGTDGALNRPVLRAVILDSPCEKKWLESLIHPEVFKLMDKTLRDAATKGVTHVAVEMPLLYEIGMEDVWDLIIMVSASHELRVRRIMQRNNVSRQLAEKWIGIQAGQELHEDRAHVVINNNGPLSELEKAARQVARRILTS
jgi:dephospho-CoA kinase